MKEGQNDLNKKVQNLEDLGKQGKREVGEMLDIFKNDINKEVEIYNEYHLEIMMNFIPGHY